MKQKLIIHQANDHVTEMAFNCEICLKGFVGKVSLDRHQKNMHKNEKKFKCEICLKIFGHILDKILNFVKTFKDCSL